MLQNFPALQLYIWFPVRCPEASPNLPKVRIPHKTREFRPFFPRLRSSIVRENGQSEKEEGQTTSQSHADEIAHFEFERRPAGGWVNPRKKGVHTHSLLIVGLGLTNLWTGLGVLTYFI